MAKEISGISLNVTANTSGLEAGMAKVAAGLELSEKQMKAAAAAGAALEKQQNAGAAAAAALEKSLKEQAATLGMSANQIALYKARLAGATEEQLKGVKAALAKVTAGDAVANGLSKANQAMTAFGQLSAKQIKAIERHGRIREIVDPMTAALPALSALGKMDEIGGTGKAIGAISGALGAIPHPAAQAAGAVVGLAGGAFDVLNEQAEKARASVLGAFGNMTGGAMNLGQAVSKVKIDALADGAKRAEEALSGSGSGFLASAGTFTARQALAVNPFASASMRADFEVVTAVNQAATSEANLRRLAADPRLQALNRMIGRERAQQGIRDMGWETFFAAARGEGQGAAMAGGATAQEAADAAAREALVHRHAIANDIGTAQARADLAPQLADLARDQERARAGAASQQVGQSMTAGREELDILGRREFYLRTAIGLTVDMSHEESELARLRAAGASREVVQARWRQLQTIHEARLNLEAATQGRALRESTRNPLEVMNEEMARLDEIEARGGASAEVIARGRAAAVAAAERGVGEAPIGQAALMEGSAAAASAILKAQREQQRENPMARLELLTANLLEHARASAIGVRDMNDALEQGEFFRAVGLI